MRNPTTLTLLSLAVLLLAACGKNSDRAQTPSAETVSKGPDAVLSIPADPSMPSAASAASSAATGTPTPARQAGRTNATLTPGQESSAMPVAGQNNDHSAPLASAEPASAPR